MNCAYKIEVFKKLAKMHLEGSYNLYNLYTCIVIKFEMR